MKNQQHACDGGICKSEWRGLFSACGSCVGGMISGTAHEARAMSAVIGHDPIKLDMHQLQASSRRRQSASKLPCSIT